MLPGSIWESAIPLCMGCAIHTLPNISRSKANQTRRFGQFVEYNMVNIFLEKLYTKYDREASRRPFSYKIKIKHISGSTVLSVIKFVFIVCPSRVLPKYIKTKVLTTCF